MNDYRTVPNPALQPDKARRPRQASSRPSATIQRPQQPPPAPRATPQNPRHPSRRRHPKRRSLPAWVWIVPVGVVIMLLSTLFAGLLTLNVVYGSRILPGVRVADVNVGGLSQDAAAQTLAQQWQTITLRDGERTWTVSAADMGLSLDATETAAAAFTQGHGSGGIRALIDTVQVAPVVNVNRDTMTSAFIEMASRLEIPATNAGVRYENGQVVATPPENGRKVNIDATIQAIQSNAAFADDGTLQLRMAQVQPTVTDATPIVERARAVLSNPLDIRVFDPVTGDSVYWSLPPQQWGNWLTVSADPASSIGLSLDADAARVRDYLSQQAASAFDDSRTIDVDAATQAVRQALQAGDTRAAMITVKHQPRTYTVKPGDSITSIGWDFGIPYLFIQEANNNLQSVSVGQQITIPAADSFLKYEVIPNKRIVVDISEQRTRVYENGTLKWDWGASTGIADSPTWTGIYQVISHEPNAYAGNWNLWMPNFIGVYQPVPGSEFTNGFHGFPTRNGGQLLWQNSIGTRVTYGCILLSDTHAQILYNWAEEGVVVEIRA